MGYAHIFDFLTEIFYTHPMSTSESSWQIENLLKAAFIRTKERFLSYFLALLFSIAIGIASFLVVMLVGVLLFFIYSTAKSALLGGVLLFAGIALFIVVSVYVSAWTGLVLVDILIQEKKIGVIETFKKMRSEVWGWFIFTLLSSFFFIGLIPFGLMTIGVIFILWIFWGSFSILIYLYDKRKGLENLWASRAMINQKFWPIAGRLLLLQIVFWFIGYVFNNLNDGSFRWVSFIFSFITAPYATSYLYEVYTHLEKPKTVQQPFVWVLLSLIGWIILIILLYLIFTTAANWLPAIWERIPKNLPPTLPPAVKSV